MEQLTSPSSWGKFGSRRPVLRKSPARPGNVGRSECDRVAWLFPRIAQRVVSQKINELEPCGWLEEIVETARASDQGRVIKLARSISFAPAIVGYAGHAPDRGDHAGRCPALCRTSTNRAPGAEIRAALLRR
jgi:hypothetical protein